MEDEVRSERFKCGFSLWPESAVLMPGKRCYGSPGGMSGHGGGAAVHGGFQ